MIGVIQRDRNRCKAQRLAVFRAGKNDVLHIGAAELLFALLTGTQRTAAPPLFFSRRWAPTRAGGPF